jgi:hypothetical protein
VGRAEMCFYENDEVRRVRAGHGEGEGPFVVGETIDVEEEDVIDTLLDVDFGSNSKINEEKTKIAVVFELKNLENFKK